MDVQLESQREARSERGDGNAARDENRDDSLQSELDTALARIAVLEQKLAGQASARAELVHLVSHELRTPITVISGFGRLLQNEAHGSLNKEQLHYIDQSLKACRRLDQFVVDLLEAQPESGTPLSIQMVEADLHALIRDRLESLGPVLEERGIEIELQLAASSPRMSFDDRRIEQVLTNLLSNAMRYGRPGGVIRIATNSIRDAAAESDSARGAVEVIVEDDGPGIPKEDRERLFSPYVRGDAHDDCEGLGIGLAICRRVIAAHGGSIRVEASALGGARFVFELPGQSSPIGQG